MYTDSQHTWTRAKWHIQGIWHNLNTLLDLLALHKDVVSLRNTKPACFDAASISNDILKTLQACFSFMDPCLHLFYCV